MLPSAVKPTAVLTLPEIFALSAAALVGSGATRENADPVARSIQDAEAEGFPNGGLTYLLHYCEHLRSGRVDGRAVPIVRVAAPSVIQIDAAHGFCHSAFVTAEQQFVELTRQTGIASLGITRSHSASALGWFVDRLSRQGLVSIGCSNSSPLVAPWGGKRRFFGTNPLAFGAPRTGRPPLVIDMATSQTARLTVIELASSGRPIAPGLALDTEGRPTTDPQRALDGTVAPLGGHKGTGLALMVEILAAGLTEANWSHDVVPMALPNGPPPGVGQFFIALAPERLGVSSLATRLDELLKDMLSEEGVRVPGDRRLAARARAEREGVSFDVEVIEKVKACAR